MLKRGSLFFKSRGPINIKPRSSSVPSRVWISVRESSSYLIHIPQLAAKATRASCYYKSTRNIIKSTKKESCFYKVPYKSIRVIMINSSIRVHTIQPSQLFHLKSTFFIHKPHSQERISRSSGPYLWSKPRTVLRATHLHATSTFLGTSTCSSTLYQGLLIHQAITIHHLCIYLQLLVSYTFKDH